MKLTTAQMVGVQGYKSNRFRSIRVAWVDLIAWLILAFLVGLVGGFAGAIILYYPEQIKGG